MSGDTKVVLLHSRNSKISRFIDNRMDGWLRFHHQEFSKKKKSVLCQDYTAIVLNLGSVLTLTSRTLKKFYKIKT